MYTYMYIMYVQYMYMYMHMYTSAYLQHFNYPWEVGQHLILTSLSYAVITTCMHVNGHRLEV